MLPPQKNIFGGYDCISTVAAHHSDGGRLSPRVSKTESRTDQEATRSFSACPENLREDEGLVKSKV